MFNIRLLHMPLALRMLLIKQYVTIFRTQLIHKNEFIQLLLGFTVKYHVEKTYLDKETIQSLLKLCHSNREGQTIHYAVYKVSGLSERKYANL